MVLIVAAERPLAADPSGTMHPGAAGNPCEAKPAVAVSEPVAETAFKEYTGWKKVNATTVLSTAHGNRYVFTYLNKTAEGSGLPGKFPFPVGAILAMESFEAVDGKPGPKSLLFIMEKRGKGYDREHADWHYAVVESTGVVSMRGSGHARSPTRSCATCHVVAKTNDYVFGRGTIMKVTPTRVGGLKQ
jgi:hypothetical protein